MSRVNLTFHRSASCGEGGVGAFEVEVKSVGSGVEVVGGGWIEDCAGSRSGPGDSSCSHQSTSATFLWFIRLICWCEHICFAQNRAMDCTSCHG